MRHYHSASPQREASSPCDEEGRILDHLRPHPDMALLNEGGGSAEVRGHLAAQHEAGQAAAAERGGCDIIAQLEVPFGGDESH